MKIYVEWVMQPQNHDKVGIPHPTDTTNNDVFAEIKTCLLLRESFPDSMKSQIPNLRGSMTW